MPIATPTRTLGAFAALLALAGCVSPQDRVADKEDLLTASGFRFQPANTPARQDALHGLPPERFVRMVNGDNVRYVFADPLVCNCLYVGDQNAYGQYRQNVFQRRLVNQQQLVADTFAGGGWDWGVWGPWGPY